MAAGQEDGKAHQAVLNVLLIDAVLVNPQTRFALVVGLEGLAPSLKRFPLPATCILPAVAKESVDVLQLAWRGQPLESWIRA